MNTPVLPLDRHGEGANLECRMAARAWSRCDQCFREHGLVLWPNLSRAVSLLAVLNTSLFFLSGAVTQGGYSWPVASLVLLGLVEALLLLPLGLQHRLWFYLGLAALTLGSGALFIGSVVHWLRTA